MTHPILPGAEAWSHVADAGAPGALCIHGWTGNPGSMRGVAEAFAHAGFHVELPRLPGHGTHMDDMLDTTWDDWSGEVEEAYQRLAARSSGVVAAGQSMGGSLSLWLGAWHAALKGLVCINPAVMPQPDEVFELLEDYVQQGIEVLPGIGSDIADPAVTESAYEGSPVRTLLSLFEAVRDLAPHYPDIVVPLLLIGSRQDHVVEPAHADYLAERFGGSVERVTLERSFHVATLDYDKELIFERSVEFARRVATP